MSSNKIENLKSYFWFFGFHCFLVDLFVSLQQNYGKKHYIPFNFMSDILKVKADYITLQKKQQWKEMLNFSTAIYNLSAERNALR